MPVFSQQKKESKKRGRKAVAGIPQEIVNEYKEFVSKLARKSTGTLEFKKTENIALGRKALLQAGVELKKYLKVKRARGSNTLTFERIDRKAWVAAQKGKKTTRKVAVEAAKPKAKRKAKAKAKKA